MWIIGNQITVLAQKRAALRDFNEFKLFNGLNIEIFWFYFNKPNCCDLSSFVNSIDYKSPNVIIFHLGSEFVGHVNTFLFIAQLKQELFQIHNLFSYTQFIFSEILPVLFWSHPSFYFLEKIRKRINRSLVVYLPFLNGLSLRHSDFESITPGFYLRYEFSLSPVGLDLFNLHIQSMIEIGLWRLGRAKSLIWLVGYNCLQFII